MEIEHMKMTNLARELVLNSPSPPKIDQPWIETMFDRRFNESCRPESSWLKLSNSISLTNMRLVTNQLLRYS